MRVLFTDRLIQMVAEDKIRAAIAAGEFDDLPGFGKPDATLATAHDPHSWLRRKLKREGLVDADLHGVPPT